jgi:4-hydroxy-2-oxoheptanedioate aldolase
MRKSKTLEKFRSGDVVKLAVLGHYIPAYVSHAARAGYDCIWLDLEHKAMGPRDVEALLVHFHLHDIDCMLRPPTREKARLYRYLEDGAAGLMIPHVNTPEEARLLVQAVKFPPLGDRGMDNAGLDSGYRLERNNSHYAEDANRETFLTIQIETPEAVRNCEAMAAMEGIDALFVGPSDLGYRYKLEGDTDGSKLEEAFETVAAACKKHGKAWGAPAFGKETLQKRISQGGQLLANFDPYMAFMDGLNMAVSDFAVEATPSRVVTP